MTAHWKVGTDFAIRYGGRSKLEWFSRTDLRELASKTGLRVHPFQLLAQAAEGAGAIGTWWETRRQTQALLAQFEERRLLWCADLLSLLASEIAAGCLQADTTHMLERELRRTMAVLDGTKRMEIPYSFLLQCDRMAKSLSALNRLMGSELRRALPAAGTTTVPRYLPHDQFRALLPAKEEKAGVLDTILKAIPALRSSDDPLAAWMRNTKKDPELACAENLALELRNAEALLEALRGVPETTREPDATEEVAELEPLPNLAAALGVPLLPAKG